MGTLRVKGPARPPGVPDQIAALEQRTLSLESGGAWTGATNGDVLTYGSPPTWQPPTGGAMVGHAVYIQESSPVEGADPWLWLPIDGGGAWDETFHVYAPSALSYLLTEAGDFLITEAGDLLVLEA